MLFQRVVVNLAHDVVNGLSAHLRGLARSHLFLFGFGLHQCSL
jgi:hypothetical protein